MILKNISLIWTLMTPEEVTFNLMSHATNDDTILNSQYMKLQNVYIISKVINALAQTKY